MACHSGDRSEGRGIDKKERLMPLLKVGSLFMAGVASDRAVPFLANGMVRRDLRRYSILKT
jgi:hypothetical protein